MKKRIAVFLMLSMVTFSAQASTFNELWTAKMALLLSKVQNPQELQNLPMSKKNREIIKNEISQGHFKNINLIKVNQTSPTAITISADKYSVEMNLKNFDQNQIFVQGKKITLNEKKTYHNYRVEVQEALRNQKVSLIELALPRAHAAGILEGLKVITEAMTTVSIVAFGQIGDDIDDLFESAPETPKQSAKPPTVIKAPIDQILVTSYVRDYEDAKAGYWRPTFTFTCDSKSVQNFQFQEILKTGDKLKMNPLKDEHYTKDRVDSFKAMAKSCCEKDGCYEAVKGPMNGNFSSLSRITPANSSGKPQVK